MFVYFIPLIALAAVAVLLFVLALICHTLVFGRRMDKNPYLKYFTADDFGLTAEFIALPQGLNGYVYRKASAVSQDKLIIFSHGMGAGHIAYTTEIAYFCNLGYSVLAVDSRGCNFSRGRNLKGMYSGVQTIVSAIDYVRSCKNLPQNIYLVGHSWGAYSVLCASFVRKVSGTVAISSPDTPVKMMRDASAQLISKPLASFFSPFWFVINFLCFGVKGNLSAAKSAMKSSVPTLLIHGENDKTVPLLNSAFGRAEGDNIKKILAKGKAHNPYNTVKAEELLAELNAKLTNGDKDFTSFDFSAATREDEEVMQAIAEFIAA